MNTEIPCMADVMPEGEVGAARVSHFELKGDALLLANVRAICSGFGIGMVSTGRYARLSIGSVLWMSDTQLERRSSEEFLCEARGDVLISGLGLGMVVVPLLSDSKVHSITVIERSEDVVQLIEPRLKAMPGGEKLTVIVADVFEWQPPKGQTWDVIYHDVWLDICTGNLKEIAVLKRKFARRKRPGGWHGAWLHGWLTRRRRQEQRRSGRIW